MKATIYHNPRCSKSRETLALLRERGVDVEVVEYLQDPPTVERLDALCGLLGVEPVALLRAKETRAAELGLTREDRRSRQEWLKILVENPVLIERPIVVKGGRAALGRPPENVLAIL
jgi:arsenate reductase